MKFETKFNIGQDVYFINRNAKYHNGYFIDFGKIKAVRVSQGYLPDNKISISYSIEDNNHIFLEHELGSTTNELYKTLLRDFD